MRRVCISLLIVLPITSSAEERADQSRFRQPTKAVVSCQTVITCVVKEAGNVYVCLADLKDKSATRMMFCSPVGRLPLRWTVGNGRFFPMDDEGIGSVEGLYRYRLDALLKGKLVSNESQEQIHMPFLALSPLYDLRTIGRQAKFKAELYSDFLPTTDGQLLVFCLTNVRGQVSYVRTSDDSPIRTQRVNVSAEEAANPVWSITVYRSQVNWDPAKGTWIKGDWLRVESFSCPIRETFQVLSKDNDYYFVTESGKLYCAGKRRILTGQRDMELVWSGEIRPITHFITDADAEDRTFLFCKPAKEGENGVFFELGPKPEPKPYDLSKVKPSKADEPLKSVLERARFLADQNLLKNPVPPREEKKP